MPGPGVNGVDTPPGSVRRRRDRGGFWRGHRTVLIYAGTAALMIGTVVISGSRWGPAGTKLLVGAGILAVEALLVSAVAAGVAMQWRRQARLGGRPASWPLVREWAQEYFGGHPLILAWWIPPAVVDPMTFPGAVNAAVFLVSGNPSWIKTPGISAIATQGGAWAALGEGTLMTAFTGGTLVFAVLTARIDAHIVARRSAGPAGTAPSAVRQP
jgi:hypothetical protein